MIGVLSFEDVARIEPTDRDGLLDIGLKPYPVYYDSTNKQYRKMTNNTTQQFAGLLMGLTDCDNALGRVAFEGIIETKKLTGQTDRLSADINYYIGSDGNLTTTENIYYVGKSQRDVFDGTENINFILEYKKTENIPTKTSDLINDGDNGVSHFISLEDLPSNIVLYATNVNSDVSGYYKMVSSIDDPYYNSTAVDVPTGAITTTNQLISSLITSPNLIVGDPGIFNTITIGNITRISGSGSAEFYFKVYKRTSAGVETLITTSSSTLPVLNTGYTEFSANALWNDGSFASTDRIVIKFYGSRISGGSNPSYQFQFGGSYPVRTLVPVPLTVIPAMNIEDITNVSETAYNAIQDTDTILVKQASASLWKPSTWSNIKSVLKTYLDTLYNNSDFYKYSIVTSVTSGNLTVAIKNYAGNDPTPTAPIKIQIGGVIRTITGALSTNISSGSNWFNSGSTELATQEIDYFVYMQYNSSSLMGLGVSRIGYATSIGNDTQVFGLNSGSITNEKTYVSNQGLAIGDPVENIGRFNAILSATYQWSIPTTSIIINRPIYETRYLTSVPTVTFIDGTAPTSPSTKRFRYKIVGDTMHISYAQEYSTAGTGNSTITLSLPFSENTIYSTSGLFGYLFVGGGAGYGTSNGASAQCRGKLARVIGSSINSNGLILGGQIQI